MSDPVARYLAALSSPNDDTLAALGEVLAEDVRAVGMFGSGTSRDKVLASTAAPPYPLLASAAWGEPVVDGDRITVRGALPEGLPVVAATVSMLVRDGRLVELAQELEPAPPPAPTALAIDDEVAAVIDGALDNKTPFVVGYVDGAGVPHLSPRGTVQSWSADEVAMWARDPNGGLLRAIATNPNVSLFYRDGANRVSYELIGRARVEDDPAVAARVWERSPAIERNLDPRRLGKAVIVAVDSLTGSGPTGRLNMRRGA